MPVLNVVIWYQVKVAHKKTFIKGIMAAVIVSFFAPGSRFHAKKRKGRCCRMAKLTLKQQRFVDEYLIDLNATQASIRAGYSVKTAKEQGSQNLTKLNIQQAISEKMAERSRRTGVNQDRVVLELAKIAFVKMTDIVDNQGKIKSTATEDDLACIESMKYKESESETGSSVEREVKISPKLKALELLGKHLGMWNDRMDVNVNIPVVISGEEQLED
jgi:phage terminase small subunit